MVINNWVDGGAVHWNKRTLEYKLGTGKIMNLIVDTELKYSEDN